MFEYKFVKIEFKKISGKPKEDYREVIKIHAEQGGVLSKFSLLTLLQELQ